MTGIAPDRPMPADRPGRRTQSSFSERSVVTAPRHRQLAEAGRTQWQRLAAQPWPGLGGLLLAAVVFFALALGTGSTATGLLVLGPISTFGLAGVAMIAFWWNGWPGSRLAAPWTGVLDTVLAVAAAVGLTIAGQAVIERPDIRAVLVIGLGAGTYAVLRDAIRATPDDWITSASLSFAGAGIILHVAIGLRWPFAAAARKEP